MCYIQVKNIRLNSFYEEKKIKLCLTKQLLNMFKLWCEWGISSYQRELTLYGDRMIMSQDHVSPEKERNKVGWSCTCHAFNNRASNTLLDKHMQRRIVT